MSQFRKISDHLLFIVFSLLSLVSIPLIILYMVGDANFELYKLILWIVTGSGLLFIAYEIVCICLFKRNLRLRNYMMFAIYCVLAFIYIFVLNKGFEFIVDHTLGYIFKGLFWLLDVILPKSFTLVVTKYADLFYKGIKNTLSISLLGTIIGFIIACILGTLRTIKVNPKDSIGVKVLKKVSNAIIKIYVTVFRGTPMMVQAMIIFYGFVGIFQWDPVTAGLVIVSINTGAYLTEVVKNGIDSIDKGQMEAARSLGFSYPKAMLLVIFPQAIKNSMASIGNEFVINIKDTSVLNVIGCAEMYYILNMSAATNYKFMEQMIVGALVYLLLTFTTTKTLEAIEKKLDVPTAELKGSN